MKNYAKEYNGREVPEGATRVSVDGQYTFIMNSDGIEWYWTIYNTSGNWQSSRKEEFTTDAIELPEQPMPSKAEWMPEVGEECLGNIRNDMGKWSYVEVTLLYQFESEWAVAVNGSSILSYCDEFRPLKTAEKKKREAFKLEVSEAILEAELNGSERVSIIANALFDAGFTAPDGEL